MDINIFGSTGTIGIKTLNILYKSFPSIKINLLVANNNYKKLIFQSLKYKPNYISIKDKSKIPILKKKLSNNCKVKFIEYDKINDYISKSKSTFTILAIAGYEALNFLEKISQNTKFLGLVNKECIVSAGHLFKKLKDANKDLNILPLDSEHFSLNLNFYDQKITDYKFIYITASGGPFFNKKNLDLKKISFEDAIRHPKWKMGYKNSIDSASLVNKCLEIIEAHYLFSIPFKKLKILIHPESVIHSIIENKNYTSNMNYFYPDMYIPIFNFFQKYVKKPNKVKKFTKKFDLRLNSSFNFYQVNKQDFPIYKIFDKIDKSKPLNLIKFNVINQYAVESFKYNRLSFQEIPTFINNAMKIKFILPVNSIKNIIKFHHKFNQHLINHYEK